MTLYHYTRGFFVPPILLTRQIQPRRVTKGPHERPSAWLSTSSECEPTSRRKLPCQELDGGYWRIKLKPSRSLTVQIGTWEDWCSESGVGSERARKMAEGYDVSKWRFSFQPIPLDLWSAVEKQGDSGWQGVHNWIATAHFISEIERSAVMES